MKSVSLAAVLVLAIAAPAFAADDGGKVRPGKSAPAEKTTDKNAKPEDKLICTRETGTDSFISKRVCRTQAQIDEERRGAQQLNDDRELLGGRPDLPPQGGR
ncbi:MAG TPA: hypothetical protein VFN88_04480 [Caulobacteraceae bacterium]|nr:hypothetical protein [Caulobacteraceae bacterium]